MRITKRTMPLGALPAALIVILTAGSTVQAQHDWQVARGPDRFGPLHWLIGEWQGYGKFSDRSTLIHKSFFYDVAGMYLIERTIDMFPPDSLTTEFEVHQDFTVYYRHNRDGSILAKGFFVESYVTFATVEIGDDGRIIVVGMHEVENGPPGMRTRYTIRQRGADQFEATFEIAMPGEDYVVSEELLMKRMT
jgi:hypothetical protein